MATLAPSAPSARSFAIGGRGVVSIALLLAAAALRLPHLGDPSYMIDEQFYLVAGNKLLHGALPYVDFWDRKPVGLFLIYAVAAVFGSGAVLTYQLMALGSAAATAAIIARVAQPMAGRSGAFIAGLLYLLWIDILEGGGGQSPVFYNLPMALAGWATLRAGEEVDDRRHRRLGFAAMALAGVAIQIKYTAAFESLFFGLVLAWWTLRRLATLEAALTRIALLAATALAPTMLATGFYVAIGQGRLFFFSNFVSIFLRGPTAPGMLADRVEAIMLLLSALAVCIVASLWLLRARSDVAAARWRFITIGWCATALVGLFSVGTLYLHYLLPVFVPFVIAAAPIFGRRLTGPVLALFCAVIPLQMIQYPDFARTASHQREIAALTRLIPERVDRACLQIFQGPSILYWTSHACTVGRFIFPDHLMAGNEADAIGTDTVRALRAILARRPLAITIGQPDPNMVNRRTYPLLRQALARDYHLAGAAPFDRQEIEVWVRR